MFKIICIWNSEKHITKAWGSANNSTGNICLKKLKSGGTAISTGVCKFQLPGQHSDYICMLVPTICGTSVQNFFYVTLLASGILRWLLHFLKNLCTPQSVHEMHFNKPCTAHGTYVECSMTINAVASFSSSNFCVILAGTKTVLLPTKLEHFEPRYICRWKICEN